ncbi:hypothetical protein LCGC14_0394550 [marine sediment metagenome]|uniref:Uncharacterized protein n=1 Tax=marine sediment metagenome TaxID=412755 RepID=A0A0F9SYU1_9ZZZZ
MRRMRHKEPGKVLHIETPLGIVNIRVGLRDLKGRAVDSIQIIPDQCPGEQKVVRRGGCPNIRLIQLKRNT